MSSASGSAATTRSSATATTRTGTSRTGATSTRLTGTTTNEYGTLKNYVDKGPVLDDYDQFDPLNKRGIRGIPYPRYIVTDAQKKELRCCMSTLTCNLCLTRCLCDFG